ncbi:hypothetical protein [Hydrogenophaga atypica]|uniref:Uncharacterized protein n=1 Tax=Hydrogenophaga atypica TaxID=249409 RepID=A0ABW2QLU4_9BURK
MIRTLQKNIPAIALGALVAFAAWAPSGDAIAQNQPPKVLSGNQVVFPAGLKWERLVETTTNFDAKSESAPEKSDLMSLSQRVWSDEVQKALKSNPNTGIFFLTARLNLIGKKGAISIAKFPFNYELCIPPANGKNAYDMFSMCNARVAVSNGDINQVFQISEICYLNIDFDTNNPVEKNHTAVATDPKSSTIYLRVIQYGKSVPGCNRAIRL